MLRKIQRAMLKTAVRRGVFGNRNKATRFAFAWANVQASRTKASTKRRKSMVSTALAKLGMKLKSETTEVK